MARIPQNSLGATTTPVTPPVFTIGTGTIEVPANTNFYIDCSHAPDTGTDLPIVGIDPTEPTDGSAPSPGLAVHLYQSSGREAFNGAYNYYHQSAQIPYYDGPSYYSQAWLSYLTTPPTDNTLTTIKGAGHSYYLYYYVYAGDTSPKMTLLFDCTKGVWTEDAAPSPSALSSDAPTSEEASSSSNVTCGNGQIDPGEKCDDGNANSGDGCSSSCQVETGYSCTGTPSVCNSICGDGIVTGSEQCDDGNTTGGDGCDGSCNLEAGYTWNGTAAVTTCGDGICNGTESANVNDAGYCPIDCGTNSSSSSVSSDSSSSSSSSTTPTVTVGPEEAVFGPAERKQYNLSAFPDGGPGAILNTDGSVTFFAPGFGFNGDKLGNGGTVALGNAFKNPAPLYRSQTGAVLLSLLPGSSQPSPDGSDFDRDYSGGGPTYKISNGPGQVALLQVYHGEYHFKAQDGVKRYYSGLGLAISYNGGKTFQKLGQIVQGAMTLAQAEALSISLGNGGGPLIEADQNGQPVTAATDANSVYYYTFFGDLDDCYAATSTKQQGCSLNGIAFARAKKSDVIAAAFQGTVTPWQKYYVPSGTTPQAGIDTYFTEPGIGGHFTPILTRVGQPSITYDRALQAYVIAYEAAKGVFLRTSTDLLNWSDPVMVTSPTQTFTEDAYTSIIGVGGGTLTVDKDFYVYYLASNFDKDFWDDAVLNRRVVHVQ